MIVNQSINLAYTNAKIKNDLFWKYECLSFANYTALNKATQKKIDKFGIHYKVEVYKS